MKRIVLLVLIIVAFCYSSFAQNSEVKVGSSLPVFKILQSNGKYFTSNDVPKNHPFVLIYFAPDCDHCIIMLDELFKKIHQLERATIMLVTFKPINDVIAFERKYNTLKYKNLKVGTEGVSYILRNYYRLEKTPFTAVYDRQAKLAFSYKNETPVGELLQRFKKV